MRALNLGSFCTESGRDTYIVVPAMPSPLD